MQQISDFKKVCVRACVRVYKMYGHVYIILKFEVLNSILNEG